MFGIVIFAMLATAWIGGYGVGRWHARQIDERRSAATLTSDEPIA